MGLSKKHQVDGGSEPDGKKWVIAGIMVCAPLRSITTKSKGKDCGSNGDSDGEEDECSTTPTAKESKIPEILPCPPAPRKRRPSSTCHYSGVREFFTPPDLESIFVRQVERAN